MKSPRVEVVCIGSELLTGRVNTHASYLGTRLGQLGLSVAREHTVPDDEPIMVEACREAFRRADIVISCGGLGPTFDDLTREVWSRVTGRALRANASLARDIRSKFSARGLRMPPANLRQALVLRGAAPIRNQHGTAPGQFLRMGGKILILLPGPSRELYPMVESTLLPRLSRLFHRHARLKTFLIAGVPESRVDELVRPLVDSRQRVGSCRVIHGILASHSLITVKFRVEGPTPSSVESVHRRLCGEFRQVLGALVIGEDEERIENVVGDLLVRRGRTVALAESCTGGLVSKMLTDRAGSSRYMAEGVVAYSNAAKTRHLGVPARHFRKGGAGAVSGPVARAMAEGVRTRAGADYGVAITGIAGPGGDGSRKPVGLVFIACASRRGTVVKQFRFKGDRAWIRERSAVMALDLLRQETAGDRAS